MPFGTLHFITDSCGVPYLTRGGHCGDLKKKGFKYLIFLRPHLVSHGSRRFRKLVFVGQIMLIVTSRQRRRRASLRCSTRWGTLPRLFFDEMDAKERGGKGGGELLAPWGRLEGVHPQDASYGRPKQGQRDCSVRLQKNIETTMIVCCQ